MSILVWKEWLGPVLWRVRFSSDVPGVTFYVWVDGRLFATVPADVETDAGFVDVPVGLFRVVQIDVFDDPNEVPGGVYPATVTLRWEPTTDAALYRVEQWVAEAWVVLAQVPATGDGLGRWESAPLADGVVHVFRVVPVDGTGRDGVAREFSGVMCRWPDAPDGVVTVVAGEFVISG